MSPEEAKVWLKGYDAAKEQAATIVDKRGYDLTASRIREMEPGGEEHRIWTHHAEMPE